MFWYKCRFIHQSLSYSKKTMYLSFCIIDLSLLAETAAMLYGELLSITLSKKMVMFHVQYWRYKSMLISFQFFYVNRFRMNFFFSNETLRYINTVSLMVTFLHWSCRLRCTPFHVTFCRKIRNLKNNRSTSMVSLSLQPASSFQYMSYIVACHHIFMMCLWGIS